MIGFLPEIGFGIFIFAGLLFAFSPHRHKQRRPRL
jgi:hypothetical protein